MNASQNSSVYVLAKAVTSEIRAYMGARRLSGNQLAKMSGMSQNYFATRLRDEKPFDLDDIDRIVHALDDDLEPQTFIAQAYANHSNRIFEEEWMLAARDTSDDEESEAQQEGT